MSERKIAQVFRSMCGMQCVPPNHSLFGELASQIEETCNGFEISEEHEELLFRAAVQENGFDPFRLRVAMEELTEKELEDFSEAVSRLMNIVSTQLKKELLEEGA